MPEEFRENGFPAVGEAIGNVGRWLSPRRRKQRDAEQTLARWLRLVPKPTISTVAQPATQAQADAIEGTWRVISEEGEQQ